VFRWRYFDPDGHSSGESDPFESAHEAEAWLEEVWQDLVDDRVGSVELIDSESAAPVYRMSLAAANDETTTGTAPS